MKYQELKELFRQHENTCPSSHLTAYITFSSFGPENNKDYPWESRTYVVSSDNKAFQPNMGGYSIFGSCLDGGDRCIRLENYIADERGGKSGWIVEDCCIVGYLLVEASDMRIPPPDMFYSLAEAQDQMLTRMAECAEIDPLLLKTSYAECNGRVVEDNYSAEKYNAWAGIGSEGTLWEIKRTFISGPLNIAFAPEPNSDDGRG